MTTPKERAGRFGELQLAVLRVLWRGGECTVEEICRELRPEREVAYSTVSTVLSRLLDRDVVSRRKEGRSYRYRAELEEDQVRGSMVEELLDRVFGGDPAELVNHLLRRDDVDEADLDRLREMIEAQRD